MINTQFYKVIIGKFHEICQAPSLRGYAMIQKQQIKNMTDVRCTYKYKSVPRTSIVSVKREAKIKSHYTQTAVLSSSEYLRPLLRQII
jgi:hypothetical protein